MTYLHAYNDDLERTIEGGGDQARVERAISEYNLFDDRAFQRWWDAHPAFNCAICGAIFKTDAAPEATALVRCAACGA